MTLIRTGYAETIEGTVRKQRALPASFIMRMGDKRLPKLVVLGELEVGQRLLGHRQTTGCAEMRTSWRSTWGTKRRGGVEDQH